MTSTLSDHSLSSDDDDDDDGLSEIDKLPENDWRKQVFFMMEYNKPLDSDNRLAKLIEYKYNNFQLSNLNDRIVNKIALFEYDLILINEVNDYLSNKFDDKLYSLFIRYILILLSRGNSFSDNFILDQLNNVKTDVSQLLVFFKEIIKIQFSRDDTVKSIYVNNEVNYHDYLRYIPCSKVKTEYIVPNNNRLIWKSKVYKLINKNDKSKCYYGPTNLLSDSDSSFYMKDGYLYHVQDIRCKVNDYYILENGIVLRLPE